MDNSWNNFVVHIYVADGKVWKVPSPSGRKRKKNDERVRGKEMKQETIVRCAFWGVFIAYGLYELYQAKKWVDLFDYASELRGDE